ncbi:hypothetical protein [Pleionea litopenaei]|uniref:PsbP protein n=1 Tax=Pleionea litopenaei TaxID=3070815 RepID=A0AA51X7Q2_9GAMM|nr:hypothetical protein [Pleionea sp. HL-JVS1]WMS88463.1 hypothetical protein Q9312_05995 [Pleionea sp. HL-JVS1]
MRILFLLCLSCFLTTAMSEEFETQELKPLGGKIRKPKSWFYRESHGGPHYIWTISKEESENGEYKTGVRIQATFGIEENTEMTRERFIRSFIEMKKSQVEVLSECKAEEQGMFFRICLETKEPAPNLGDNRYYRIQYSLFWGKELDLIVIQIAGTPEEYWSDYQQIFQQMRGFDIFDLSRID